MTEYDVYPLEEPGETTHYNSEDIGKNANWLLNTVQNSMFQGQFLNQANQMMDTMLDFKELMMAYSCAIKEIRTKFEVLDTEFRVKNQRNPIKSIHSRLKSNASIMEKMNRKGVQPTAANVEATLNDVAGVRVVCSYVDDIYNIAEAFKKQSDITILTEKDYIKNPKDNGYRSLHLISSVPVYFAEGARDIKVEVQIRTIAMDYWASLEHQLRYKQDVENEEAIASQLKQCADLIAYTDLIMQNTREQIDRSKGNEINPYMELFEKIKKLDSPLADE